MNRERAVTVITGSMASGKSTVAEALARRLSPGVHLRGDVFRKMIVSGRVDMADPPTPEALRQLDLRHELTAQAARVYWDAGFHVVVQDNFLGTRLTYFLERLGDAPKRVFVLNPSAEAIRKREAERLKKGYVGFGVEGLRAAFLRETPRIGCWLDTSDWTVEETVERILTACEGDEARLKNDGVEAP